MQSYLKDILDNPDERRYVREQAGYTCYKGFYYSIYIYHLTHNNSPT